MDPKILYADNHIIAAEKPVGILTQTDERANLEDEIKEWVKKEYAKKGAVFLHAVHRLDKGVSGIVLFAKTSKALSRLNEQMREKGMRKIYVAKVEGRPKEGILRDYLVHDHMRARVSKEKGAKLCELSVRILKEGEESLIEVELHTGRYHQIRAQLAHHGHPILGDAKYGSTKKRKRIYLHHSELTLIHPTTKEELIIRSDSPFFR